MIEQYALIHILKRKESDKRTLNFFTDGCVLRCIENQVPLVVEWFEGMKFSVKLKEYRRKVCIVDPKDSEFNCFACWLNQC